MHVAIIQGAHSYHDSWAEALEHIEAKVNLDHRHSWFRETDGRARIYQLRALSPFRSNRGAWSQTDRALAEIIEYHHYQVLKSREDLIQ